MSEAAAVHLSPKRDLPAIDQIGDEALQQSIEQGIREVLTDLGPDQSTTGQELETQDENFNMVEATRKTFEKQRTELLEQLDDAREQLRQGQDRVTNILNTLAMYERGLSMPAEDKGEPEKEAIDQ